jgi:membrane protein YqaA with SNARE-associated domain
MLLFLFISFISRTFLTFAHRFGLLAFVALGLVDSSVIPVPGSMDALAIFLAASNRRLWWHYALMATAGAVVGGYVSYRIARKAGKAAIEKELGDKRFQQAHRYFGRMGFWSVFIGAIAPPPVPTSAFVMVAGALEYPRHRFLLAISSARLIRFLVVTWVASHYGRQIFQFFGRYYRPALWTLVGIAIAGAIAGLVYYLRRRGGLKKARDRATENKAA